MDSTPEVWILVFQHLTGDYTTLCNVSLVSRTWRTLSWPCLLANVDISSHNIERRLIEYENQVLHEIYSHHHAKYRPQNLIPRQRAFLRLITNQPGLAKHVRSFTWTLVWSGDHGSSLLDIDRETWNVFARMLNVTRLDLASIHEIWEEDITRQNPTHLFPKVNDLRLLGWMHRGLVRAVVESINASKLRSLKLDHLEDQGAFPGGHPMNMEIAEEFAQGARDGDFLDEERMIDDELFQRQELGKAAVFPGPMWYPMRLLSGCSLDSLSLLRVTVPHFDLHIDVRNYYTTFREAATLLRKTSSSLKSLVVILEEYRSLYYPHHHGCGTSRVRVESVDRPWCIKLAATFLKQLLIVLEECPFPNLTLLTFEGFHQLEHERAGTEFGGTLPDIGSSRFNHVNFTGTPRVDSRHLFTGFDCTIPAFDEEVLRNS